MTFIPTIIGRTVIGATIGTTRVDRRTTGSGTGDAIGSV
jgi:hypothetical protein